MPNASLLRKIWLKKDEVPILVIRRSFYNWFWPLSFSAAIIAGDFFLMYYLWQFGWAGLLAFSLFLLLAAFLLARTLFERHYTCWILTNLRLIDMYQSGFFRRETAEAIYNKLKDVRAGKSGILPSLFNLGDIRVSLEGSRVTLLLAGVRGYERAVSEIILQQENYQKNLTDDKESRAQYVLARIKNKIGAEAFRNLLGD